jgi:O-antigen ligase
MNRAWALRLMAPKILLAALIAALGTALALVHWRWALVLTVGGVTALALVVRPECALCLLAFAVPFGSIREWALGPVTVSAVELVLLILSASWVARMVAARRIVVPRAPLLLPLVLLVACLSLSTLTTSSLELSVKEILKWVEVLLVYSFMAQSVDRRWGKWIVLSVLAAGSAEALVGVYQFFRQVGPEGFILFGRFMRAYGHFAQPNPFAGYLGLTLPLAYALTLDAAGRWQSGLRGIGRRMGQGLGWAASLAAPLGAFVVMFAAAIMSWSRGAWIGVAAALVAVTLVRSRTALLVAAVLGVAMAYLLVIGGARYVPPGIVQRLSDFLPYLGGVDVTRVDVTDANWAVVERMAHWQAALGMFSDHLWLGVGAGNYAIAYPRYALGRWRDPLGHAHNYYLNIAAEAGVLGIVAYCILFAACFVEAMRVVQRLRDGTGMVGNSYWRAVALGALGVLVHLSVHSLFDNLYVHGMNVQLGLALGLLAVATRGAGGDANRV